MNFLLKTILVTLLLALPLFAKNVATLTALKGSVSIQNETQTINATLGAALQEKDHIITADKSKAQIIFEDETIVTVGKNSDFSIAKYIYEANQEPTVEFGLIKGAMSTISGKIGKIAPERFAVKTKTATIGIRGTNFTVLVLEDGSQNIYCTYGAISVTLEGNSYIVEQGFYLSISSSGEIAIKPFEANELEKMKKTNFGEDQPLKGNATEDGIDSQDGSTLDTTTESLENISIKDITDDMQDALQTLSSTNFISMKGWSADNYGFTTLAAKVSLNFAEDGSSFDTTNSWIQVLNKSNASGNGEYDNWKFTLASTPTNFTDSNHFTTTFASATLTPLASSTSTNPVLVSSSFNAITDLANDDYMSWGTWSATVDFESVQSGLLMPDSSGLFEGGLWIAGVETDPAVVASLTSFVSYIGKYLAVEINAVTPEEGVAYLDVDFAADQATLTISGNGAGSIVGGDYQYNNMFVSGNTLSGGILSQGSGSADGTFYGPNAESVGGNFEIQDSVTTNVKGVYQVTQVGP